MLIAINYADINFKEAQSINTKTAYTKGRVDKVIEYSPEDIEKDFYLKNKSILDNKRGGGYWLWKPYIILKTMEKMNDGDYLFYCDSGAAYINKVQYLIKSMEDTGQDIMPFELPLIEKQWTQNETFKFMNCYDDKFKNSNQILATYMLIKVSYKSKQFIKQYLELCENQDILIDNYSEEEEGYFLEHRHDQSIFSLLCKKYNLQVFRDPSQYGIRPWEYLSNKRMYKTKNYENSFYPQILVSFRKENADKYIRKDKIKYVLTKLRILNKNQFIKKNNIKMQL